MDYLPGPGMLLTRYAPLRRSPASIATPAAPRLACVKPAASVHPEPGSNSSLYMFLIYFSSLILLFIQSLELTLIEFLRYFCLYFLSSIISNNYRFFSNGLQR